MMDMSSKRDYMELARRTGMPPILADALARMRGAEEAEPYGVVALEGREDAARPVRRGGLGWPPLLGADGRLTENGGLDRMGLWHLILVDDTLGGNAALISRCEAEPYLLVWPAEGVVGERELSRIESAILGNGQGGSAVVMPPGPGPGCLAATTFAPRPPTPDELAYLALAQGAARAAPRPARH
jgi:hypothetical protein